jgi:hypothetical protein
MTFPLYSVGPKGRRLVAGKKPRHNHAPETGDPQPACTKKRARRSATGGLERFYRV